MEFGVTSFQINPCGKWSWLLLHAFARYNWEQTQLHGSSLTGTHTELKLNFTLHIISSFQPSGDSSPCSSLSQNPRQDSQNFFATSYFTSENAMFLLRFPECPQCPPRISRKPKGLPSSSRFHLRVEASECCLITQRCQVLAGGVGRFSCSNTIGKGGGTIQWPSCGVKPSIWLFSRWIRAHMNTRFVFWLPKVDS